MWALIFAGTSAGAGLFGAVDGAIQMRAINRKLDKIIEYLKVLDSKIDEIKIQNSEILHLLDQLPLKIRQIVQEVVGLALIDVEYNGLLAHRINITELGRDGDYRITEAGWRDYAKSLTYVFTHEYRLSDMFRILLYSELALCITRNQAKPFIRKLFSDKMLMLNQLRNECSNRITVQLTSLKALLDVSEYIESHNLNEALDDFSKLQYYKRPDRTYTRNWVERVCRPARGPCPSDEYEICKDVPRSEQLPDTLFHQKRDSHVADIESRKPQITAALKELTYLSDMIRCLESYWKQVEAVKSLDEQTTLFHSMGTKALVDTGAEKLNDEETSVYFGYYDDITNYFGDALTEEKSNGEIFGFYAEINRTCPPV